MSCARLARLSLSRVLVLPLRCVLPHERRVPVVLDRVVGPARQHLGDDGPFVAVIPVRQQRDGILPFGEGHLPDGRVQLIAPAQPARLAGAPRDPGRDDGPVLGAVLLDELRQLGVLVGRPGTWSEWRATGDGRVSERAERAEANPASWFSSSGLSVQSAGQTGHDGHGAARFGQM